MRYPTCCRQKNAIFHLVFTDPVVHLLGRPCTINMVPILPAAQAMPTTLSVKLIGDGLKLPVDKTTGNPPKTLSPLMSANCDMFVVS